MIPLLQTKTADTAHMGSVTRPSPQFWAGPGDEASRNHKVLLQGVVTPIAAVVTAATRVKKRSRAVFGVGQAVKAIFKLSNAVKMQFWMVTSGTVNNQEASVQK